jgi:hypothetical protein
MRPSSETWSRCGPCATAGSCDSAPSRRRRRLLKPPGCESRGSPASRPPALGLLVVAFPSSPAAPAAARRADEPRAVASPEPLEHVRPSASRSTCPRPPRYHLGTKLSAAKRTELNLEHPSELRSPRFGLRTRYRTQEVAGSSPRSGNRSPCAWRARRPDAGQGAARVDRFPRIGRIDDLQPDPLRDGGAHDRPPPFRTPARTSPPMSVGTRIHAKSRPDWVSGCVPPWCSSFLLRGGTRRLRGSTSSRTYREPAEAVTFPGSPRRLGRWKARRPGRSPPSRETRHISTWRF